MIDYLRNNKLFVSIALVSVSLLIWSELYSFKIFYPEGGEKWTDRKAMGNSINHK